MRTENRKRGGLLQRIKRDSKLSKIKLTDADDKEIWKERERGEGGRRNDCEDWKRKRKKVRVELPYRSLFTLWQ